MTGAEFGEVDFDLLADYIGGALEGTAEDSAVAALIATDPAWREAYGELSAAMTAVSADLGQLAPEPMPAELASRLESLFAEASAPAGALATLDATDLTGAAQPSDSAQPIEAAPPADAAESTGDDAPVPPPAVGLTLVHDADSVGSGARGVRRKGRRLRWATPIAVAAATVAFVGFGLDYLAGRSGTATDDSGSSAAGYSSEGQASSALSDTSGLQILSTGTDYTRATLGSVPQDRALAASQPTAPRPAAASPGPTWKDKESPERSAASSDPLARLRDQSALQQCFDAIAAENGDGPISPISVDYARFAGAPAVVISFTAGNGTWAWASGPDCGTPSGAATLDKVPVR